MTSLELDPWQKDILATKGNIVLCSGRQCGKSTIISRKASEYAINHPKKVVMVVAAVERQAYLLFEKIIAYTADNYPKLIKKGKDKPTKSKLQLKNGSVIYCLPTGLSGYGIRGFSIDQLYVDEAAFVPDEVFQAITPALVTTGGDIILLSTPYGREGYFFQSFNNDGFTKFQISTEEVAKQRPTLMRERMDKFLEAERERMTKKQYQQEYLGLFVHDLSQYFPDDLIKKCMTLERPTVIDKERKTYIGVDLARMGDDESVFSVVQIVGDTLIQVESIITRKTLLTMSARLIRELDLKYNFREIYVDEGGIGVGCIDILLEDEQTRRKVKAINNLRRAFDHDPKRMKKLMKEDLYNNLLRLMEQDKIKLLSDPEIFQSLKSVQYEYSGGISEEKKLKIFGHYTHCAESLIRAAWCMKTKSLSIYIY